MRTITDWRDQDVLHFEVSDWVFALQQADIFDENALRMIHFVYEQPSTDPLPRTSRGIFQPSMDTCTPT